MALSRVLVHFPEVMKVGQACPGLFTTCVAKSTASAVTRTSCRRRQYTCSSLKLGPIRPYIPVDLPDSRLNAAADVPTLELDDGESEISSQEELVKILDNIDNDSLTLNNILSSLAGILLSGVNDIQINQGLSSFDNTFPPHVSYLVSNDVHVTEAFQEPLAVKIGGPLDTETDRKNFNSKEDIWMLSEDYKSWCPQYPRKGVINTDIFKTWTRLIDLAVEGMVTGNTLDEDEKSARRHRVNDIAEESMKAETRRTFGIYQRFLRSFQKNFTKAIEQRWTNAIGRRALYFLLQAAEDVCWTYRCELEEKGHIPHCFISSDVNVVGGSDPKNVENCKAAIRTVSEELSSRENKQERETGMRSVTQWKFEGNDWRGRKQTPDVELFVTKETGCELTNIGYLVFDITSDNIISSSQLNQTLTQALKGLVYNSKTAAMVVTPVEATFIHISAEKGFINREIQKYSLVHHGEFTRHNDKFQPINHNGYQELFKDLVLYLWDSYYQHQFSGLPEI